MSGPTLEEKIIMDLYWEDLRRNNNSEIPPKSSYNGLRFIDSLGPIIALQLVTMVVISLDLCDI
jgi:hypothetical protein